MTLDPGWKKTIDDGFRDPARHQWDAIVLLEVADYNLRLVATKGYVFVEHRDVLAIVWVESGGPLCATPT